jgi:TRAP-type C4-dicarboxylate transport system permease small subunit
VIPGNTTSGGQPPRSWIAGALTLLAAAALGVMMLWTMADVALRATLKWPLHGSVAVVETMLVLVSFLALADCLARDEQIKVDVFDQMVSPKKLFSLKLLGDLAMLVFLLLLAITMIRPMLDAWRFWDIKPDIPVPIAALLAAIEVALLASAFVVARKILRAIRAARSGNASASGNMP